MADVARAANLSPTTVSFVINDVPSANIPAETRQRVWQAVRALGYRPNAAAKSLRTQRTDLIGFVTDEIAITPFAGEVIKGAQEAAWANGKLLVIVNTGVVSGDDDTLPAAAVEALLERQVEGIIYGAMFHQRVRPPINLRDAPTVLLDCFTAERDLTSVVPDERGGGRLATQHLIDHGHRRIGLINVNEGIPAAAGRLAGYLAALEANGLPFDPALIHDGDATASGGYYWAHVLLGQPDPPTAIFCGNDRMAMGAYDALRELGLRVPEDVSVVGFDNQEIIAAYLRPALTTVALPHYAMGRWAVEHLLSAQEGAAPVQHVIACPLVARASVARRP
jgi:LacI family transcriptional regulator